MIPFRSERASSAAALPAASDHIVALRCCTVTGKVQARHTNAHTRLQITTRVRFGALTFASKLRTAHARFQVATSTAVTWGAWPRPYTIDDLERRFHRRRRGRMSGVVICPAREAASRAALGREGRRSTLASTSP